MNEDRVRGRSRGRAQVEDRLRGGQILLGRRTDLRCADLRRTDLRCADLRCADFRSADLRRADLRRADLRHWLKAIGPVNILLLRGQR